MISEPEPSAASTMTTPRASPEMMRLRRGKWRACGAWPSGISETTAPSRAQPLVERLVFRRIDDVGAAGEHGDRAGGERALMGGGIDAARHA